MFVSRTAQRRGVHQPSLYGCRPCGWYQDSQVSSVWVCSKRWCVVIIRYIKIAFSANLSTHWYLAISSPFNHSPISSRVVNVIYRLQLSAIAICQSVTKHTSSETRADRRKTVVVADDGPTLNRGKNVRLCVEYPQAIKFSPAVGNVSQRGCRYTYTN